MTVFIRRLPLLLAAGACGLAALLPAAASAQEAYRGYQGYRLPTDRYPVSRNAGYAVTPARNWPPAPYQDYSSQVPSGSSPYGQPAPTTWEEAQALQQRCSIGRLVGGVIGGGLGYAASRDDGRTWAVPLGALLGSQVGCNAGQGRGPLPW
ncbi:MULTISPECIES: glycine zipper 2TM domain-containing protein [unclassified Synechococcus]|uniref:glycine zipper 2TM domain-containing protein n=1 Tax=unclassified Synechococcus TaxID=2626047 RepID=UPI0000698B17|nr:MULTISPECIES: glycine zipper 2TM domain-containing protein [unclassified Synechococcus]EAQ74008.1 hypothetical protein WH5701_10235 [Synechococcus sp. WH 5701]WFN58008.1 glycine zipper 2TM domain-containing protein [Synechococcus sp. CCFWC 502]